MIITGMAHFESVCKNKLVEWYNHNSKEQITLENVFVVWACKTLQNYKALLSTTITAMAFTLNIPTTATNKKCTKTYTRRRPIAASERKINHDWRFI